MNTLFQKMRNNRQRILRAQGQNPPGEVQKVVGEALESARFEAAVQAFRRSQSFGGNQDETPQQRWYRSSAWFKGGEK